MERPAATSDNTRWWHSRSKRRRPVVAVALVAYALFAIELFAKDRDAALFWWLAIVAIIILEWLWFRFLDPAYPHDDSMPQSEVSYLWSFDRPWWESRYRRRNFLFTLIVLGGVTVGLWIEVSFGGMWAVCYLVYLLLDWAWFRFFDPHYPQDDIPRPDDYTGPPAATIPDEAWQGALVAIGIIALVGLAIWLA